MSIIKCKMCGGDLRLIEGSTIAECEYCGSRQTVPSADNEKKLTLFARSNRLRAGSEFDKAAGVYEAIVADFPEEAEAYWGLILCKYGIEYVDDPATGKKVPTCHRTSFDSVMDDSDFELVMEYSDPIARRVYREEAKQIEELRKNIIEVSSKEEPYDIFICYKETDENGDRTLDSVLAQDVYDMLTENGYRVFFSRVTLEDKLGQEYEPYIFAALHSAKIMLAFGTDYEYYNAVWVKNEWSRFLQLIATGEKKSLIPCYKNLDAYDMPKEFAKLQAQDMGKVGAMQDLMRGIKKILPKIDSQSVRPQETEFKFVEAGGPNTIALLKRGFMALEDRQWDKAKAYFDHVLNMDAENHDAYLGMAMAINELDRTDAFCEAYIGHKVPNSVELMRARQFSDDIQTTWWNQLDKERSAADEKLKREEQATIRRLLPIRKRIEKASLMISAGSTHTVGLKADGTVLSTQYRGENEDYCGQCNVSDWKHIVAISASCFHTVGLKADGSVVATEYIGDEFYFEQCNVGDWRNIIAVSTGIVNTVGLKADGTVVVAGDDIRGVFSAPFCPDTWRDIIAISMGLNHIVGLKADGTVVAGGSNEEFQCDVQDWKEIVAIAAGTYYTVGLLSNGKVVATGNNDAGQCNTTEWTDIVSISANHNHTVGIKADGSVVAVGSNLYGQCNVTGWHDIIAISTGEDHTVGLKADGTVISTPYNGKDSYCGQCEVSGWRLFQDYFTLEQERKEAIERAEQERKEATERAERERKEGEQRRRE